MREKSKEQNYSDPQLNFHSFLSVLSGQKKPIKKGKSLNLSDSMEKRLKKQDKVYLSNKKVEQKNDRKGSFSKDNITKQLMSSSSLRSRPMKRTESSKVAKAPKDNRVLQKTEDLKSSEIIFSRISISPVSFKPQFTLEQLFETMIREGASDLHIATHCVPALRINEDIVPLELPDLDMEISQNLLLSILSNEQKKDFEENGEIDFSLDYRNKARFRVNYFRHHNGIGGVFRYTPLIIPSLDYLGLPSVVKNLIRFKKGLILVVGPGNCGKSTTIASMINEINKNRKIRIITLEKPIEYVIKTKNSLVSQREIGNTALDYSSALWAILREDPDVIMISELLSQEDIRQALKISETGHLVITTLRTLDSTKAIERIVNAFPLEEQDLIKVMLSECLTGVIAQRLIPRADGMGRVLAGEILLATTALASIIREGKFSQIMSVIQTGGEMGMQTMDQSILNLFELGLITVDMAKTLISDRRFLKRAGIYF